MNKNVQFAGIIGLIAAVFGIMINSILAVDDFNLVPIHFGIAVVCLLFFFIFGGSEFFRSAAAKRAAGFGAGVTLYSAVFLGLLVIANYAISRHEVLRFDSTEQKVHTLAPQTLTVLSQLKHPVLVRAFYLGGKVDQETEALLDRMKAASSNFTWTTIDPEKRKSLTEKYGISETATLHFTYELGDGKIREGKVVRDTNEQEIVNLLIRLVRGAGKSIYYVTGHGESDLEGSTEAGYLFLKEALTGESLEVKPLVLQQVGKVPDDASALLLLAPRRPLLLVEIGAIKEYIARGGNAVLLTEPRSTSDVRELAKPLGITVGDDIIVDQLVRVFAGPGLGVQPMVTNYGIHPVTNEFKEGTIYSTVSSVTRSADVPPGAKVTELALTSGNSWAERDLEKIFSDSPAASLDGDDIKGPVSIAAAFEGVAPYDVPVPSAPAASEGAPAVSPSPVAAAAATAATAPGKTSRVVVVGDADFVANVNLRQLYNRDFFLNIVRWVIGEEERVSISAKTLRESTKGITDEQFNVIFLVSAVLIPELMLACGMGIWWFRHK